ncbi:hypothetical protein ACT4VF_04450 [Acinetobacter baumannii]
MAFSLILCELKSIGIVMKKYRIYLKIVKHKIKRYIKKNPFISYFLILYLGGLLLYTAIFLIWLADYKKPMALNETGDFLSGVFAPLAFLFLYLGYRQQGKEMQQNTAALKLQAYELKKSVEEQKRLIKIHEDEQQEKHFQVLPDFRKDKQTIKKSKFEAPQEDDEGNFIGTIDEDILEVSCKIINYGEVAKNVLVKSAKNEFYVRVEKHKINHEEELVISLELDGQIIERLEAGFEYDHTLTLTYNNIYGKAYTKFINYKLCTYPVPEEQKTYFSASFYIGD